MSNINYLVSQGLTNRYSEDLSAYTRERKVTKAYCDSGESELCGLSTKIIFNNKTGKPERRRHTSKAEKDTREVKNGRCPDCGNFVFYKEVSLN